ncbi:hypothetical protein AVEN_268179-1 [Araneus ventricosus]|uniref:Uncharacterized protein n=1 Tax=Araneus ventricosus TaxID=182803 RepID=A0A4Y2M7A2_ARAVE|nr:hypothetical protein AVEN_268179-1 [Araneus ventricosus]
MVKRHWYILIFHIVTMVIEAFVPSVNQYIETGMEGIRFEVAEPFNDGFLSFGIGSEMETLEVLFQGPNIVKSPVARSGLKAECSNVSVVDVLEISACLFS